MTTSIQTPITEPQTLNRISILLADDHPLVQDGILTRFEEIDDIEVIGVANNGQELLDKAMFLKPDVIITDISMPKITGLEATRLLSKNLPDSKILILTMHDNKEYVQNAIDSGAKGYVLKDQPANELIEAVRSVHRGDTHFCSSTIDLLSDKNTDSNKLTKREQAILMELLNGLNNKHISEKLSISLRTVECHRGNIYRKLDTHSMAGLIRYAKKVGFI